MAAVTDTSGTPQTAGHAADRPAVSAGIPQRASRFLNTFPIPKEQPDGDGILQGRAMGEWAGVSGGIKAIACPMLFATGTEDVISPPRNSLMMAVRVPGSWLSASPAPATGSCTRIRRGSPRRSLRSST